MLRLFTLKVAVWQAFISFSHGSLQCESGKRRCSLDARGLYFMAAGTAGGAGEFPPQTRTCTAEENCSFCQVGEKCRTPQQTRDSQTRVEAPMVLSPVFIRQRCKS